MAGVNDCANSEINVVRSKYQGQSLVNSFYNEDDKESRGTLDRHDDLDLGADNDDSVVSTMVELHRSLEKDLNFKGLPIDSM